MFSRLHTKENEKQRISLLYSIRTQWAYTHGPMLAILHGLDKYMHISCYKTYP